MAIEREKQRERRWRHVNEITRPLHGEVQLALVHDIKHRYRGSIDATRPRGPVSRVQIYIGQLARYLEDLDHDAPWLLGHDLGLDRLTRRRKQRVNVATGELADRWRRMLSLAQFGSFGRRRRR